MTPINFEVRVEGDSLYILGSYADVLGVYQATGDLDLRDIIHQEDYTLNDEDHGYVGIKLGDANFGIYALPLLVKSPYKT